MILMDHVSCRNIEEHSDFIGCFCVSACSRNIEFLTRCFLSVFSSFKSFPLKGLAGIEHAALPFGDGRRV